MDESITLGIVDTDEREQRSERSDAAANRQRILETARVLFAEHGVAAVNMADIASEAGVGKGTLYRRFTNKGDLCLSLLDETFRVFQDARLADMRAMTVAQVPYMDQLDRFLEALVFYVNDNLPLFCEIEAGGLMEGGDINAPHYWQEMTVRGLLQLAMRAGELPADLDVDYIASALLAPLNARILRYQQEVRGFSLAQIGAGLRSLAAGLRCE